MTIGFALEKINNESLYIWTVIAYFFGLGISAHCFDQLKGMGSSYVKHLTQTELFIIGLFSLVISLAIGTTIMLVYSKWNLIWLMPLQAFFVLSYPVAKLFKGIFHTDFWFAVSFGAVPVIVGYYINTDSFTLISSMWAVLCFSLSYMEITLSRYVRKRRKEGANIEYYNKPEKALKILCALSYLLALIVLLSSSTHIYLSK
ncbi:MAG: hypothetical protein O8C67_04955 [Candidatus Methanoperedens sp.]|nr:hypothetical protein [Candidatus Methanoperedens sp.]